MGGMHIGRKIDCWGWFALNLLVECSRYCVWEITIVAIEPLLLSRLAGPLALFVE
jgi:hypothetical protein